MVALRFIPAYAGNAILFTKAFNHQPVHPRIRGERHLVHQSLQSSTGSSPHTRGTHCHIKEFFNTSRFIPAYAGNAPFLAAPVLAFSVHPRIRGERWMGLGLLLVLTGSSPHTRGTLISFEGNTRNIRFIPAYAGNAGWEKHTDPMRTVHPRIRGERRGPSSCPCSASRFIPAYAGNAQP